jgi:maltooligosyltrehalose synthase
LKNFTFDSGGWIRHHRNSPGNCSRQIADCPACEGPDYAQPVEIVAAMSRVRLTRPRSQKPVAASRTHRWRQSTTIEPQNRADENGKRTVLQELRLVTQERESRHKTLLGRFLQCQELQMCSALLARAVEQCSCWHRGKSLAPPGGCLPPGG